MKELKCVSHARKIYMAKEKEHEEYGAHLLWGKLLDRIFEQIGSKVITGVEFVNIISGLRLTKDDIKQIIKELDKEGVIIKKGSGFIPKNVKVNENYKRKAKDDDQ